MSKSSDQHGGEADGKTFGSKAPEGSPEFGVAQRDAHEARGTVPGTKQLGWDEGHSKCPQ
jgi:hypothetical protein